MRSYSSAAWLRQLGGQGTPRASPRLADLAQHLHCRLRGAWSASGTAKNEGSYCQGALQRCWEGTGRGAGYFAARAWEGMRGMMEDAADVIEVAGQERR